MKYKHGHLALNCDENSDTSRYSFIPDGDNISPHFIENDDALVIYDASKKNVITVIKVILDLYDDWPIRATAQHVNGRQKGFDLQVWIALFLSKHPAVLITKDTDELEVKKIVLSLLDSEK